MSCAVDVDAVDVDVVDVPAAAIVCFSFSTVADDGEGGLDADTGRPGRCLRCLLHDVLLCEFKSRKTFCSPGELVRKLGNGVRCIHITVKLTRQGLE